MKDKERWILLAAVLGALAYIGYSVSGMVTANADLNAPPKQGLPEDALFQANLGLAVAPDGHSVFCQPGEHHAGYTYTPHRYPRSVGGNITNTIHHGFSSMRVPGNACDAQWIISPPSEVQW